MDQYSYNMLAAKVYELEAEVKRLRIACAASFKLICQIGLDTDALPAEEARRALDGLG